MSRVMQVTRNLNWGETKKSTRCYPQPLPKENQKERFQASRARQYRILQGKWSSNDRQQWRHHVVWWQQAADECFVSIKLSEEERSSCLLAFGVIFSIGELCCSRTDKNTVCCFHENVFMPAVYVMLTAWALRTWQSRFTEVCECYVRDMENVSNTLDNSGCLQLVDKQGTPSGTRQHFPHEVNVEEESEAKNMTAQGCKHPDKTTQRETMSSTRLGYQKSGSREGQNNMCQLLVSLCL